MTKLIKKIKHTGKKARKWQAITIFILLFLFVTFFVIKSFYVRNNELKKNENSDKSPSLNQSCIIDFGKQECKNIKKEFLSAEINQFLFESGIVTCLNDSSWIYIQITKEQIDKCFS